MWNEDAQFMTLASDVPRNRAVTMEWHWSGEWRSIPAGTMLTDGCGNYVFLINVFLINVS